MNNYETLFDALLPVAKLAGDAIMKVYKDDFDHNLKEDGSPVTLADQAAEEIILGGLKNIAPQIPVISEENPNSHSLEAPQLYFLVDPLDGTKEFLKRDDKGAFTVNIALVENRIPIFGIVYAPALNRMFYGAKEFGAFENENKIKTRIPNPDRLLAVASQSHRDEKTQTWLEENQISETVSIGSSLKFGLLASGEADIYPRFGPTMEWDTAAGDAVLRAAGGMVFTPEGKPFLYGKHEYKNTAFIAKGFTT